MSQDREISGIRQVSEAWRPMIRHYEQCIRKYGATPQGLDWPNGIDLATRFGVMLELLSEAGDQPELLDLGCGPGLMLDFLSATQNIARVKYWGVDLSSQMVAIARQRWPQYDFSCRDIVAEPLPDQSVDVVIMNGVLTERVSLDVETITALAQSLVTAAFSAARVGIVFNTMNANVDWQRDDLFHWSFDALAKFLRRDVSSHYTFRSDYGLYEYTCIVRRQPRRPAAPLNDEWWVK